MIEIKNLTVSAGGFALQNINLSIEKGSFHILVGPTGSGKSLLTECMLGLRKAPPRTIFKNHVDISQLPPEKRGFSYAPQDLAVFPHLTIEENIFYAQKISRNPNIKTTLIEEWIEITGLRPLLKRNIKNLSGGEKQRVSFVRALAAGNDTLVLDEPFSSMDKTMKLELQHLLMHLHEQELFTIFMITHDLEEAFTLADNISVMQNGTILQSSPKDELYRQPASLEVARFLGISNIFRGIVEKTEKNRILIYSPELKTRIISTSAQKKSLHEGKEILFGIRNDEVMILREDLIKKNQSNLLKARVKYILKKESTYLVKAEISPVMANIYTEVPAYAFEKLNLVPEKEILLTLREEMVFIMD